MHEDLMEEVLAERNVFITKMQKSIDRMGKRLDIGGLTVELMPDSDEIELFFGHRPDFFITQQNGWMQIHIDPDTDDIVGLTLRRGSDASHDSEFERTLRQLSQYGTIHISPEKHSAERMADAIKELVMAS